MQSPTAKQVREARIAATLTQPQAAAIVYVATRTWQQWEAGVRKMHPAFWELFTIKLRPPST
jgi:DNA-binding transcriptional regulator YiaG